MRTEVSALLGAVERMARAVFVDRLLGRRALSPPAHSAINEVCAAADLVHQARQRAELVPAHDARSLLIADAYARRN